MGVRSQGSGSSLERAEHRALSVIAGLIAIQIGHSFCIQAVLWGTKEEEKARD